MNWNTQTAFNAIDTPSVFSRKPRDLPKPRQASSDFSSAPPFGNRRRKGRALGNFRDKPLQKPTPRTTDAPASMARITPQTASIALCCRMSARFGTIMIPAKSSMAHRPTIRSTNTVTTASVFLWRVSRAA